MTARQEAVHARQYMRGSTCEAVQARQYMQEALQALEVSSLEGMMT